MSRRNMINSIGDWHFRREWIVTYSAKSGRQYKDTINNPVNWDEDQVDYEVKDKIFTFRIIQTDEWDLLTDNIEAFKFEKGIVTKNNYPDQKNIHLTAKEFKEIGFTDSEIKEELARYSK